jgi:hypothetical protein
MSTVNAAISRDGLVLARVPFGIMSELSRYGGHEPVDQLNFVAFNLPDLSSWKILDSCLLDICLMLSDRASISDEEIQEIQESPRLQTSSNIFYDILMCLLKRFWRSYMEINVSTYHLTS